ncbi:hypothetical protein ACFFX0_00575 [Citricoccus parietis]|uniref:Uncharacterized protein n=1 Tax=Citricoccus parietis TaxID=592307 RepID=A0ABV5FSX8_9MICC
MAAHLEAFDARRDGVAHRSHQGGPVAGHLLGSAPRAVDPGHRRLRVPVDGARGDDGAVLFHDPQAPQPGLVQALEFGLDPGGILPEERGAGGGVLLAGDDEGEGGASLRCVSLRCVSLHSAALHRVSRHRVSLDHGGIVCPTMA